MKHLVNILLFCLVVVISAVATFWLVNRNNAPYPPTEEYLRSEKLAEIPGDTAEAKFAYVVGQIPADISAKVEDYKKQRIVLPQIANPASLKAPEYIAENNALMKDTAEKLRAEIVAVMDIFDDADEDIEAILFSVPEEKQQEFRDQWKKLQEEDFVLYVEFFSYEDDIIMAYEELMKFYAANASEISFDAESEQLVFSDPKDAEREQEFRRNIEELSAAQATILRQG